MQKLFRSQAIAECASRMRMDGALALRAHRKCQLHKAYCACIKRSGLGRCLAKPLVSRPYLRMPFGNLGRSHGKLSSHVSLRFIVSGAIITPQGVIVVYGSESVASADGRECPFIPRTDIQGSRAQC